MGEDHGTNRVAGIGEKVLRWEKVVGRGSTFMEAMGEGGGM